MAFELTLLANGQARLAEPHHTFPRAQGSWSREKSSPLSMVAAAVRKHILDFTGEERKARWYLNTP